MKKVGQAKTINSAGEIMVTDVMNNTMPNRAFCGLICGYISRNPLRNPRIKFSRSKGKISVVDRARIIYGMTYDGSKCRIVGFEAF